jgi:hypothetical protein
MSFMSTQESPHPSVEEVIESLYQSSQIGGMPLSDMLDRVNGEYDQAKEMRLLLSRPFGNVERDRAEIVEMVCEVIHDDKGAIEDDESLRTLARDYIDSHYYLCLCKYWQAANPNFMDMREDFYSWLEHIDKF